MNYKPGDEVAYLQTAEYDGTQENIKRVRRLKAFAVGDFIGGHYVRSVTEDAYVVMGDDEQYVTIRKDSLFDWVPYTEDALIERGTVVEYECESVIEWVEVSGVAYMEDEEVVNIGKITRVLRSAPTFDVGDQVRTSDGDTGYIRYISGPEACIETPEYGLLIERLRGLRHVD